MAGLPQASVTVHVLVVDQAQPEPVSVPTLPVAVRPVLQLSVTEAVPKAAVICAVVGLQVTEPAEVSVITGATISFV